jgi:hypothetical protein|tara:strand:- start:5443 stop:5829 length:387 start_codon:yes stop_codon:yes gene_type:complete
MMNILNNKELRGYVGAGIIFFLVMGLLLFLAFVEIPDKNNDIFKVIVGMLVGSLSVVVYTFIGKNPEEVSNLTAKNESLEKQVEQMVEEKDKIEKLLRDLQTEVIEKLSLTGESFAFKNGCEIEECEK